MSPDKEPVRLIRAHVALTQAHPSKSAPQAPRVFGVAVVLEDGSNTRTFAGYGRSKDGAYPRLHAIHHVLTAVLPEDANLLVNARGVTDRVEHYRAGWGSRSDGSAFIGDEYLKIIARAKGDRLWFATPPDEKSPTYRAAESAAKEALKEGMRPGRIVEPVPYVYHPNVVHHFAEVIA